MMRKVALLLFLSLAVTGGVLAVNPSLMAGGGGPQNIVNAGREVIWNQPGDLEGLIATSEVIAQLDLETELANDFWFPSDNEIGEVRWWGGYYNNNGCGDIGVATNWNIRIYDDGGCVPWTVVFEALGAFANEGSVYCQGGLYPIFEYAVCPYISVTGNTLYWFEAQAADHGFPPQVGRVASEGIVGCDTAFRSAYFSFPDWAPAIDVFGVSFDVSQVIDTIGGCIYPVPTVRTTWGAVKGLYR